MSGRLPLPSPTPKATFWTRVAVILMASAAFILALSAALPDDHVGSPGFITIRISVGMDAAAGILIAMAVLE